MFLPILPWNILHLIIILLQKLRPIFVKTKTRHILDLNMSQFGMLGGLAILWSNRGQVQCGADDGIHFLSPSSLRVEPQPSSVRRNTNHGGSRHEVSKGVGPPGVVVVLVDQVLPGDQLEEEDPGADEGGDACPAGNKEVAGVVANHVAHCNTEPSSSESPRNSNAFKEHQEEQTHSTSSVLIKQLEDINSTP